MSDIIKVSFKINFCVFRLYGLFRSNKLKLLSKIHAFTSYGVFNILVTVLGYIKWFEEPESMTATITPCVLVCTTIFILKFFMFLLKHDEIQNCANFFAHTDFVSKEKVHVSNVKACVRHCQKLNIIFFVGVMSAVLLLTIYSLLSNNYNLILNIWLPYNHSSSLFIYYLTNFGLFLGNVYYCYLATTFYSLYFSSWL